MTTFQAMLYSVLQSYAEFTPFSGEGIQTLLHHFSGWDLPPSELQGAMTLAVTFSLLFHFRHDWLSQISSMLGVIFLRKRPMTIDERLPFLICWVNVPLFLLLFKIIPTGDLLTEVSPPLMAALMLLGLIFLGLFEKHSKKNRNLFDWSIWDATLLSVGAFLAGFPLLLNAWGSLTILLILGFIRNFQREALAKFALYCMLPLLLFQSIRDLHGFSFENVEPVPGISWTTFGICTVIAFITGLTSLRHFIKMMQSSSTKNYRIIISMIALFTLGMSFWAEKMGG